MYAWRVNSAGTSASTGGKTTSRFMVTGENSAQDAFFRAEQSAGSGEVIQSVDLLGSIPGFAGSSANKKPSIYYVLAAYVFPSDPYGSGTTRRVVTDLLDRLDVNIGSAFDPSLEVGPIATGPNDPIDQGKVGVIVALFSGTPEEADLVLRSEVFNGQVREGEVAIISMQNLSAKL